LFINVFELLPAQVMAVTSSGQRKWRSWQPDLSIRVRYKSDDEYPEHFRTLLEESIRCRMRSTTPVGVMMSGGLDSTSVACLAASMLAPASLTTISYVYDELADCDERKYMESVKERWDTRSIQFATDDAWPFQDWQGRPFNPNQPEDNPYRLIIERAYRQTQTEGLRVLLTGGFGDHLYTAGIDWLADLICDGRVLEAMRELVLHFHYAGLLWNLKVGYLQRLRRRLLDALPGGRRLHRKWKAPAWLEPLAADYLIQNRKRGDPAFGLQENLLGIEAARGSSSEVFNTSRYILELRHPYRDRRLVEFVLALPAYQLYYRGFNKHILRTAMRGRLPEVIRARRQPTSLLPLYFRGIEHEKKVLQSCFEDAGATWRKFVRPDWLLKRWNMVVSPENDGPELVVPWLCFSFDRWLNEMAAGNKL
ncbi:MAG: asparagine synthase-related protein, partial [Methanothrix sp.]|nr:asparagine synthase-related protein [Methanothrix sp.]